MKVLLSIKPEFVEQIFNGKKKFEYRKVIFNDNEVNTIIVYSTMPVGKIVGEFKIKRVHKDCPKLLWDKTKEHSGIQKEFYNQYFDGRESGFAIEIDYVIQYEIPLDPKELFDKFIAPQSFSYLKEFDKILANKKKLCINRNVKISA
jgi:predicted transcriptional regulator